MEPFLTPEKNKTYREMVLNDELTRNHTAMPESWLWRILQGAEQARAAGGGAAAAPLLENIWRGALWEVQTRHRAT